jgi:predicted O-methyltransferase YrrM
VIHTILHSKPLAPLRRAAGPLRDRLRTRELQRNHIQQLVDFGARLDNNGLRHALGHDVEQWAPFLRFAGPGHFYSPIPRLDDIESHADRLWDRRVPTLPGIDVRPEAQRALVRELAVVLGDETLPDTPTEGWRYHAENWAYCIGDALMLHGMLRKYRPRRIVEVGSGFSSALILDTVERYLPDDTEVTFVEPYPELLLSKLREGDAERVTIVPEGVQTLPLDVFRSLESGDVLFIDSTHVVRTGSDVCRLVFDVLPVLAPGVVVHVHDIFFPFEQPRPWVEEGRQWGETYLLRAFLSYNSSFQVELWNDWLALFETPLLVEVLPRFLRNCGGSIWLRRVA